MGLSPEERRKIYEEEKARIEARDHFEREKRDADAETSTGLAQNLASLLCYIGGWITGIIFLILEQKNATVRFHAAQSIVVFGSLTVVGAILGWIPFAGDVFTTLIGIAAFILWVVCIVKTANGQEIRLGVAAEIADRMVSSPPHTGRTTEEPAQPQSQPEPKAETNAAPVTEAPEYVVEPEPKVEAPVAAAAAPAAPAAQPAHTSAAHHVNLDKEIGRKVEEYFTRKKTGRIASSAFAIAFAVAALIFFNYFHDYVAYYTSDIVNGVKVWTATSYFTNDIRLWLPVLNTALAVSIIGHVLSIIFDRYVLRETLMIIIDAFALWSTVTLVSVFPFNFTVIPDGSIGDLVDVSLRIALIVASAGIGIGILVKTIKFMANLAKGQASYEAAVR